MTGGNPENKEKAIYKNNQIPRFPTMDVEPKIEKREIQNGFKGGGR
jgi:hypothetical protein